MRLSLPWKPNEWTEAGILKSLVKVEKVNFPQKKFLKVNFNTQRVVFREKQKITFFTKIQVNPRLKDP